VDTAATREELVAVLRAQRGIPEPVADALSKVPRHEFVPEDRREEAYRDRPLPIADGQTVSAPHMVAVMCEELAFEAGESVLEIGTGCGYHAAVTAELVGARNVCSVEYSAELAQTARENLESAGYPDVSIRQGDGREGWPERAPFDAAYLTCAAPDFPAAVVEGVREGGRLLAPLGDGAQTLVFARKTADGLERTRGPAVRFVGMR
jgi:protein-L-isoaspartate(D-aspartate) O-methyltransferase